jgi:hypothetical protein
MPQMVTADVSGLLAIYAKAFAVGAIDEMKLLQLTEQLFCDAAPACSHGSTQTDNAPVACDTSCGPSDDDDYDDLPDFSPAKDEAFEWDSEVLHGEVSYTIATPEHQAYTGTHRRSFQKARSGGCYILRSSAGKPPEPIYYVKNTRSGVENVFVKAAGLRIINGKLKYMNRSASGVETIRPIDWDNQKWHQGRGQVDQ